MRPCDGLGVKDMRVCGALIDGLAAILAASEPTWLASATPALLAS
jgi:hypothetical protein